MDVKILTKSHFLKWMLIVAIVIVLNLFFVFSIQLIYKSPAHDDFCPKEQVHVIPETKEECVAIGGQWVPGSFVQKGLPRPDRAEPPVIEETQVGYCNEDFTCAEEFSDARGLYERNFFIVLVTLGVLTLLLGFALRLFEVISASFSAGGVLAFIIASASFWSEMNDYLRVIILGIALVVLVYVGVSRFKKHGSDNEIQP